MLWTSSSLEELWRAGVVFKSGELSVEMDLLDD